MLKSWLRRIVWGRIGLLTVCLCLAPLQGQESDPFLDRMISFDKAWMEFKLEYLGCPRSFQTNTFGVLTNCSGTGSLDLKKLKAASKKAQKLFRLRPSDDEQAETR